MNLYTITVADNNNVYIFTFQGEKPTAVKKVLDLPSSRQNRRKFPLILTYLDRAEKRKQRQHHGLIFSETSEITLRLPVLSLQHPRFA